MDVFDRADIDPASWLRSDHQRDVALEFPSDNHLLLVPSRQGRHQGIDAGRSHVVLLDEALCLFSGGAPVHLHPAGNGRGVIRVEHQVLGDRERQHQAAALPILWDMGDLAFVDLSRRVLGHIGPADAHRPGDRLTQPGDRLDELGLTVSLHPGDPHDLAGSDLERHTVDR